jgi:DNA-binding LytR/AlgR family response regulator
MRIIKTIAIDDEPLALQLITGYIIRTPFLELKGSFDNPLDAMDFLSGEPIDLIFLDIQMPDLTGLEFIRTLSNKPKIIFATAYPNYALEGFKLEVIDYLLKPFNYEEFLASVRKVKNLIELERKAMNKVESNEEFLFLKSEYKIRRINFNDIIYVEGLKDYVKVYTISEVKPILSLSTLKTLESKLPQAKFMRVHRSFIVNLNRIDTVDRSRIVFGKIYIPVGDQYKEKFQKFLDQNFL